MKNLRKALLAGVALGALLIAPLANAAGGTWSAIVTGTQVPGTDSVYKAYQTTLSSPTALTDTYYAERKSCITYDVLGTDTNGNYSIRTSIASGTTVPSVTTVAQASTTTAGVHGTISGLTRRLWVTGGYAAGSTGTTRIVIGELTNCQR